MLNPNHKMKLLYITNGITGSGGLERVLSVKASALAEDHGYEVVIATLNEVNHQPFYEFSPKVKLATFHAKGNPLHYALRYRKSIKELVRSVNPDVISVCDDGLKGFSIPRILGKKIPVIYERHVSAEVLLNRQYKSSLGKWKTLCAFHVMRWLSKDFQRFVVLTEGNLQEWPKEAKRQVIPNPLPFYPQESSSLHPKKVIAVGKQSYQKAYDLLLPIWKHTKNREGWELHIYGKPDRGLKLEELKEELGLGDSVFFHPAVSDIQKAYLNASTFVLTSRYEGFGMVIIEAMSCGLPVLSFDCPHGPADIIADGKDGFLIENGNIENFAQKLALLINDFELRKEMGEKGRESVKRFLPENIIKLWDSLFKDLVISKS